MGYVLESACMCHRGRVRTNNEDNFSFFGQCLPQLNDGLPTTLQNKRKIGHPACVAVFDGMGGESYGEVASYAAASRLQRVHLRRFRNLPMQQAADIAQQLNQAVLDAASACGTERMGSTMAALFFFENQICLCNLGDSRIYRFHDGTLQQLSRDHVAQYIPDSGKKPPLTQHLGIAPWYLVIEPYIETFEIIHSDRYLLCSDGLTDMLTDADIEGILQENPDTVSGVERLLNLALDRGGKDNTTVILCTVL